MVDFEALWDYNQPEETERQFQQLLPEAALDRGFHAELLTQIARSQGLQRKFEEAHSTLDTAETLLAEDQPRARVRYYLERGRVFNSAGEPGQALAYFRKALELAEAKQEDFLAVDAAHMIAIADPTQAMAWNLRAIQMAEDSADPKARKWLGSLYNNLGWAHYDRGDYEDALDDFSKSLEARQSQGADDLARIARWCMAKTHRALGNLEEALKIQQRLLKEHRQLGAEDGYVFEELGECLLAMGRPVEAAPHFEKAYTLLSQDAWLREKEADRLARLAGLGGVELN